MKVDLPTYNCENDLPFKQVFNSYYKNICFYAYQILGDKDMAEDAAQDAFLAYWKQKDDIFNNEKIIKSYLYSTVKFIALNNIRHQKVINSYSIDSAFSFSEEERITESIIRAEVLGEIHQALDTLPESCKEIFRLGYFEGFSNAKIAEILGISINTVKTQKQRGFKVLRRHLKPEMFFLLVLSLSH